jgi:hypothetical protein
MTKLAIIPLLLVLTVATAQAVGQTEAFTDFTCGKPGPKSDSYFVGRAKTEKQTTKDVLLTIEISMSDNRERPLVREVIIRRNNYTGKMTINGKRCQEGE